MTALGRASVLRVGAYTSLHHCDFLLKKNVWTRQGELPSLHQKHDLDGRRGTRSGVGSPWRTQSRVYPSRPSRRQTTAQTACAGAKLNSTNTPQATPTYPSNVLHRKLPSCGGSSEAQARVTLLYGSERDPAPAGSPPCRPQIHTRRLRRPRERAVMACKVSGARLGCVRSLKEKQFQPPRFHASCPGTPWPAGTRPLRRVLTARSLTGFLCCPGTGSGRVRPVWR